MIKRVSMISLVVLGLFVSSASAAKLFVDVMDATSHDRVGARLYLTDAQRKSYFFEASGENPPPYAAVRYEKQNWVNANSVEYHTTIAAHRAVTDLPAGRYRLIVERGKTYFPWEREIVIDKADQTVQVDLRRWGDPAADGWYSGDTHLHRTVDELKNVILAEDLNVAMPLTNWVTVSNREPGQGDKSLDSIPRGLVQVDSTHVIWPLNTEYEIFTVGQHRHTLGALFVLGHREPLPFGVPTWKPVIEAVKRSDPHVVFDLDKLDWPFAMLLPTLAPNALYELSNNHVWRTEFAFTDWNTKAPNYMQPPFGRKQGGHRRWIDYTLGMYYTLLNCGFKLPPTAGTANGVHPVPAGFGRVYVSLENGFSYDGWLAGLRAGRSFVTTGPLLDARVNGKHAGHQFESGVPVRLELECRLAAEQAISYGELLVNGVSVSVLHPQTMESPDGAYRAYVKLEHDISESGWMAVRFWEPRNDGQTRYVHSAPWYIQIDGKPVRPRGEERDYLVRRMKDEIERSRGIVSNDAMQEYERARSYYQSLPTSEDRHLLAHARPLKSNSRDQWLDNMIIDHRYTAHEIHNATRMSVDHAEQEIATRASPDRTYSDVRTRPYPGGRYLGIGGRHDQAVPPRNLLMSVFAPWADGGYAVVELPRSLAVGNTSLIDTTSETVTTRVRSKTREWQNIGSGWEALHQLDDGSSLHALVTPSARGALFRLSHNAPANADSTGEDLTLTTVVQLQAVDGLNLRERLHRVERPPLVAFRGERSDRWLITGWQDLREITELSYQPSLSIIADMTDQDADEVGSKVTIGGLWFYEGEDVGQALAACERLLDEANEAAHEDLREQAIGAARLATKFLTTKVSTHGGYLWRYSADLELREGEGIVDRRAIWIQPPGTPTIGDAFLALYRATNDRLFLEAARAAGEALRRGQMRSGGWQAMIEFDPEHRRKWAYRTDPLHPRAKDQTSLDDDKTQSALRFVMRLDETLKFDDQAVHEMATYALERLLTVGQRPNGGFPQVWTDERASIQVADANLRASLPDDWPRTYPGHQQYWYRATLNDHLAPDMFQTLMLAERIYGGGRYQAAAIKLADFLLLAQLPDPQPGWAQQYNAQMQPCWARKFEPPAVTGLESQGVMATLLDAYELTGDQKYLPPVGRALDYFQRSTLPDGRLARFYELETNRPLYMTRDYKLTYEDDDLPTHYGFQVSGKLDSLRRRYERLLTESQNSTSEAFGLDRLHGRRREPEVSRKQVEAVVRGLDARGAWVTDAGLRYHRVDGRRVPGSVIEMQVAARNLMRLADFLGATMNDDKSVD